MRVLGDSLLKAKIVFARSRVSRLRPLSETPKRQRTIDWAFLSAHQHAPYAVGDVE